MSDAPNTDENQTDETKTDAPEADEKVETTEPESKEDEGKEEQSDQDKAEDEPETFDKAYVKQLREESASWRTKLREAEEKLKNAKSLDEVDALVNSIKEEREAAERGLLVENVALKFKLPEALAKRLTGETREELEADAKSLAELIGATKDADEEDTRLEGGLSPRDRDSDSTDPRKLAAKYGRASRRR